MTAKTKLYSIIFELNNVILKVKSDTAFGALKELHKKTNPWIFKTKGILTITKGDKSYKKIMFIRQMRKVFFSDLSKEIFGKQLEMAVK